MTEEEELAPLLAWLAARRTTVERVLVTGSRTWTRGRLLRLALSLPDWPASATLVEGDAQGADRMSGQLWSALGRHVEAHPLPEGWWRQRGARSVALERNRLMVSLGADVCLAFIRASSGGASFTADRAQEAGIPVFRFRQEA